MSTQILDDKKNPFPTYAKVPGGAVDYTVTGSNNETFSPSIERATTYEVRTTADIRIVAHEGSHVFNPSAEPRMWAGEIDLIELGPEPHPRQTITMRAISGNATVTIAELA